jgi:hypothetical protein
MLGKTLIFSRITIALICSSALFFGGCASHKPKKEVRVWDNNHVITPEPIMPPMPPPPPRAPISNFDHTTNFAGCTGNFSVTDLNGKIIQSGRAFNAAEGLYLLDAQGRKTGNIVNSSTSRNVLFQPDCGCATNMRSESFTHGENHTHPQCAN